MIPIDEKEPGVKRSYWFGWILTIGAMVLIVIYFGWIGFLGLWFGMGLVTLAMNWRQLLSLADVIILGIGGPFGFISTISERLEF